MVVEEAYGGGMDGVEAEEFEAKCLAFSLSWAS